MLKSPTAHQQRLIGALAGGRGENGCSFESSVREDASSCDADDEELPGDGYGGGGGGKGVDTVLDLSCKVKREEVGVGVKRGRSDEEGSGQGEKKIKVECVKRKHLRKKRRDLGGVVVGRPSVISFAGVVSQEGESSSTDSGDDGDVEKRRVEYRRRRKRVFVREEGLGFDVDEHFRRSLGGVVWERVVGGKGGCGGDGGKDKSCSGDGGGSGRVIIEDTSKPSDVDDHFAKALGSETWSKIIANTPTNTHQQRQSILPQRASPPQCLSRSPPLPQLPPRVISSTPTPPPTTTATGSNYKIDAILGNTSRITSTVPEVPPANLMPLPLVVVKREGGDEGTERV